jgi:antitoxin MazE
MMVIYGYNKFEVLMKKNLTAIGGSLGLIIDKPIAELYGLDRNTQVEVTPKEDGLNIRFLKEKAPRASDDEVMKAAKGINKRYGKMMKNLAK